MTQTRPGLTFGASLVITACCVAFCAIQQPFVLAQNEKEKSEPSAGDQVAADPAAQLLAEARKKIDGYESVKADLVEKVAIGGARFTAIGKYVQGAGERVRLEYTLDTAKPSAKSNSDAADKQTDGAPDGGQVPNASGFDFFGATNSMLQVSDGEVMYTMMKVGEDIQATRVNVKEVQRSVASMPQNPLSTDWLKDLGLGGVKAMLASLEKNMQFSDRVTETLNDEEFVRVSGTWKTALRQKMIGEGAPADAVLPGYIPDYVRLYFATDNMFLRRVVYLKRHPTEQKIRPMVTLDFVNIEINAPVGSGAFLPPEKVNAVDETDAIIQRLQQAVGGGTAAPAAGGTGAAPVAPSTK